MSYNNININPFSVESRDCSLELKHTSQPPPFPILQADPVFTSQSNQTITNHRTIDASVASAPPHTKKEGLSLLFAASLLRCTKSEPLASLAHRNDTTTVVESPQPGDILCGRGGAINQHLGNRIYRRIVDYNKAMYRQVPKRQRQLVSQSIVQVIVDHGGRFLEKKMKNNTTNDNDSQWIDIGFRRAVQKTSQALRERDVDTKNDSACPFDPENVSAIQKEPSLSSSERDGDDDLRVEM